MCPFKEPKAHHKMLLGAKYVWIPFTQPRHDCGSHSHLSMLIFDVSKVNYGF